MQIKSTGIQPRFGSRYVLKVNEGGYVQTTNHCTEYFMELTQRQFHIGLYQDTKQGKPIPPASSDIYGIALGNEADLVVNDAFDARLENAFKRAEADAAGFGLKLTLEKVPASAPVGSKNDYTLTKQTMVDEYKAASQGVAPSTPGKGTVVYREHSDFNVTETAGQFKPDHFLTSGKIPQVQGL